MNREIHARFCERPGGKLPRPTHPFTKLLDPDRRGRSRDAYLWGYHAPDVPAIVLEFSPSRSGAILHEFFPSDWRGDVQSDGAKMYPGVFKHRPNIRRFECIVSFR